MQDQSTQGFRLSPRQKRLWLSQRASPAYRVQCVIRLEGDLQFEVLKRAIQSVIRRHEILRTTFHLRAGMEVPFQVISNACIPCWSHSDLTGTSEERQYIQIEELLQQQQRALPDWEAGPLLQWTLVALADHKHALLLCLPSLCADAVTLKNLVRKISQAYAACLEGTEARGDVLQYADFSAWQEQLLRDETEDGALGKEYWRKQSFSSAPGPALPFQIRREARPEFAPKSLVRAIGRSAAQEIDRVAGSYKTPAANFLLACWQTLLWRLTRQPEIVVAAGFNGRKFEDLHGALGLFAQALPISSRFEDDDTFSAVLSRVSEAMREAGEWEEYYHGEAVAGALTGADFLPIGFEFEEWSCKFAAAGVSFVIDKPYVCSERFKLKLCCLRSGDSLTAEFHYDPESFLADDIERLAEQFDALLRSALAGPETLVGEMGILSDARKYQWVVDINNTGKGQIIIDECVHQLFERQAERSPDGVAAVYEDEQLSYEELNRRANRLAHYLKGIGVQPETLVGLCVDRSLEMIIGLLGILKAGGAYVPLDPVLPKERLAFMLEDSQASVLLTQERLIENLPPHNARVICLDRDWREISQESDENTRGGGQPGNAVYVLYTSGSTGKPKGVVVEHRQLMNYLNGILPRLDLPEGASFATVSTLAADLGNTAIFPALCTGGCLHVVSQERASSSDALGDYFSSHAVDCLKIVPSHLAALLTGEHPEHVLPRKRLVLGGEAANWDLITKIAALAPDCVIVNHYGPTECTVGVTTYRKEKDGKDNRSATLPIGRPIANAEVFVLDGALQPVPVWFPGELYIGGGGVSRGYLNRPELSAEKFIGHPFSARSGARLYKTGDLARYLPNGNIEYLGRVDNQVKIRGFRVELGEIEALLSHHRGVRESAVVAREDGTGERQLAAYIVPDRKPAPTIGELRSILRQKLPEYMIPSAFVYLKSLPLTPNGKVDRQALPSPDRMRPELNSAFSPPRNPAEEALAGIWREVLKIERVGIHDNFFELGGHSLIAIQVISRVHQVFRIDLPLRCLFETPTVSGLAERIERGRGEEQELQTPPLLPISRNGALPLSFAQQRLWFLDQFEPGSSVYNIPIALRLCGELNVAALEQSLDKIQRRHEAIRTSFVAVDGRPLQVIAPPSTLKLPVIDLRVFPETDREAETRRLASEEGRRPFDLTQSPLWRVALLQLREHEHILLITLHHIVGDAWSKGVINRELASLYRDFSTGQSPRLPELPIQYVDYAHWQRQGLQGKALDVQLSYWKQKLGGNLPALELPTDHPRPPIKAYRGAGQTLVVSRNLYEMLHALSQREGVSLFMTLLAAFEILLYRYTRQEDILVGTPIAGRNRIEVEGLIGFFLNNLVLRADLSGRPTYRELLGRVREVALGAYAHQDLPFEKLLEEIKLERDLSDTPLFRVFFNMHHIQDNKMELPGVKVEMLSFRRQVSHFDLTLYVLDHAEGIELALSYNADLFEPARMGEMLRQFEHLFSQIVQNPDESIDRFSLVTPSAERYLPNPAQPLDSDWKGAVHAQFSLNARKFPQRIAVADHREAWTYQELDSRSNRLAEYLRAHDVKPHDIVAIYGYRSAPLVLAVLGVLKAGAAFLILDPAYPAARLIDCLQTAKPRGWLQMEAAGAVPEALEEFITSSSLPCRLQLPQESAVVERFFSQYSADDPRVTVEADDIACIAFTSGSTGLPKGIVGRHGPLSHFLPLQEKTFNLGAGDRFSMLSGLSHDPLQREIFTPLWLGATLCIPDPQIIGTSKLADWMAEEQVTFAHLTPAMAQLLSGTAASECRMPSLRYAFFVGDKLARRDVSRLRRLAPKATCITSYGTTETQRSVGYYPVPPETVLQDSWNKAIYPLGRGIDGVQLLVLTDGKILAGVGELGEIYVRSPHLAKGYLGDEALTQARFLINPFTRMDGDRLYRTGDLGRYLPDGNVQFVRRADNQVKIRGFRIELEEVEAVLGQHTEVRECVVTAPQEVSSEERLVAYVVPSREAPPAIHELRNFLRQKLPDYMVPASFLFLKSLPLTPNGKLDREALPAPDQGRPELESEFVAPRNSTEEMLARIWADVLRLDQVGIHDNFFDLGGHSLLATQVISRMRQAFHIEIPLRALFENPTVAALAHQIAEAQAVKIPSENIEGMLEELESLSEEEAERLLAQEIWKKG